MLVVFNIFIVVLFQGRKVVTTTVVQVEQGWLRGSTEVSAYDGSTFYSFKSVPYAKPPLGNLRFKDPEPPEPWEGTRDASQDAPYCIQYNDNEMTQKGQEDCLYLNVYTSDLNPKCPLPVLFFIHGGNYKFGSGNDDLYGPDIMVTQDVVIVTTNYRLAALGFLQLDIPEVPGNAGMKDQVAALQWVQKNIRRFGGDPKKVTIMGQSAGGGSVGLHLLSPLSKGLFQRAILQSGVPINDFSTSFECRRKAFVLGKQLGRQTRDPYELLEFLQSVPAYRLLNTNATSIIAELEISRFKTPPFVPCPETCGRRQFFTGNLINDLVKGNIASKVDVIIGHTNIETLTMIYAMEEEIFNSYTNFTDLFVPTKMYYQLTPQNVLQTADTIVGYYFGNDLIVPENVRDMLRYMDASTFVIDIYRFINYLPKSMTKYVYIMGAQSQRNGDNEASTYYGINGTSHTEDLNYLFQPKKFPPLQSGSREYRLVTEYSRAFTNFVKYGNPRVSCWRPYNGINDRNYVNFVNGFSPCKLDFKDYRFWQNTYEQVGLRF